MERIKKRRYYSDFYSSMGLTNSAAVLVTMKYFLQHFHFPKTVLFSVPEMRPYLWICSHPSEHSTVIPEFKQQISFWKYAPNLKGFSAYWSIHITINFNLWKISWHNQMKFYCLTVSVHVFQIENGNPPYLDWISEIVPKKS